MAADWDPHSCFREMPVWIHSPGCHKRLRFLAPGSRLLLNGSRTEDCTEDIPMLLGYETMSGEWIALTPSLKLLKNPLELPQVRRDSEEGSLEIGNYMVKGFIARSNVSTSSCYMFYLIYAYLSPRCFRGIFHIGRYKFPFLYVLSFISQY